MLGLLFHLLFQHIDPSICGKTLFAPIYKLSNFNEEPIRQLYLAMFPLVSHGAV